MSESICPVDDSEVDEALGYNDPAYLVHCLEGMSDAEAAELAALGWER